MGCEVEFDARRLRLRCFSEPERALPAAFTGPYYPAFEHQWQDGLYSTVRYLKLGGRKGVDNHVEEVNEIAVVFVDV